MYSKTDQELLALFINGNDDAFNELYGRYHQIVRNTIRRFVPHNFRSEIDDICQHFWCMLIQYAKSFDERKRFQNWLISCAIKSIHNYQKHTAPPTRINFTGDNMSQLDLEIFVPAADEATSEEKAIINEEYGIAKKALDKIHPSFKEMINRLIIKGQTPSEYAKEKNISRRTVPRYFIRAMNRLREVQEIKALLTRQ